MMMVTWLSQLFNDDTGFFIREPFKQLPTSLPQFISFESSSITLKLHSVLSVFNIYRPPCPPDLLNLSVYF